MLKTCNALAQVLPYSLRWFAEVQFFGAKEASHVLAVQRQEAAFRACWPELAAPCLSRYQVSLLDVDTAFAIAL